MILQVVMSLLTDIQFIFIEVQVCLQVLFIFVKSSRTTSVFTSTIKLRRMTMKHKYVYKYYWSSSNRPEQQVCLQVPLIFVESAWSKTVAVSIWAEERTEFQGRAFLYSQDHQIWGPLIIYCNSFSIKFEFRFVA